MADLKIATLLVKEETGYDHDGYPMVTGVPFAQGRVYDPDTLVLRDGRNRAVDAGAETTARWADGSIKWALLTAPRLELKEGAKEEFTLALRGSQRRPNKNTSRGVRTRVLAGGIHVDTGRLRFTVGKDGPLVTTFESRVNGRWQRRAADLDDTVCIARNGERITYLASASPREVEIEGASSHRVVIAVRGTHAAEDGTTFGPYILRFECLAGSPQLRMTHSLVFDGDPETDRLCASELVLRADVGGAPAFAFGADKGLENRFPRQRAHFTADFRFAELCQDSVTHWRLERWVNLGNRAVFCAEGVHCDGWMELSGSRGRVAAAVREGWQNHPKSLFIDAETGLMRIGLYARRSEPLNLRRYSDLVYNHTYESPSFIQMKQGQKPPYTPTPRKPEYNAYGIRKTHNVALMFDEPDPSRAVLHYNKPLRLAWSPSYTKKTGVVVPAGIRLTPRALKTTNAFLDFLGKEMLRSGGTGYIDYFDLPHSFDVTTQRWLHDYGGLGYLNNEGMPTLGLWQAYLLTGRRDALEMGAAMARHNNDIDSIHLGKFAGKGCRHNVTHWACQDREPRISQPLASRFYYYITGDRSYMDMVPLMLDLWRRDFAQPAPMSEYGYVPALISSLLTAEESGVEDCEAWLRQCADAVAAGIDERGVLVGRFLCDATHRRLEPKPGSPPGSNLMFSMFGALHIFAELADRYDHQPLRDALVRYARYQAQPRPRRLAVEAPHEWKAKHLVSIQQDSINTFRSIDLYAYAYEQTGDARFRRVLRHLKGELMVKLEEHDETRYDKLGASTRLVIVGHIYPDVPKARLEQHRKLFPLFDIDALLQHNVLALWLQKLQGAAILGVLADPTPCKASSARRT
jgi:hypothetical protein